MTIDFKKLNEQWQHWQAAHPKLSTVIVLAESTAIGAAIDLLTNGYDFSQQGVKHALTIIGSSVVVALRNYFKTNAVNLKAQLTTKVPETN